MVAPKRVGVQVSYAEPPSTQEGTSMAFSLVSDSLQ